MGRQNIKAPPGKCHTIGLVVKAENAVVSIAANIICCAKNEQPC